jgi:hypothetical protein
LDERYKISVRGLFGCGYEGKDKDAKIDVAGVGAQHSMKASPHNESVN